MPRQRPMESFFGSLKTELVHRTRVSTRREARAALFEYIEISYNQRRPPLKHRLPDAGTGQEGHDHRSGRIGEEPPGPEFGVNVSLSTGRWLARAIAMAFARVVSRRRRASSAIRRRKVAGTAEPFGSELRGHLKGHSEALEDLAVEMLARWAFGTRHRGRLQGRDGAVAVVQDGDIRAGRAAVGGLPGLRHPRSGRIRHRLSVHRRDRGAASARAEARAPCWRPGASRAPAPGFSCI